MAKGKKGTSGIGCSKCGSADLAKDSSTPSGFHSLCKQCKRDANAEYRKGIRHTVDGPPLVDRVKVLLAKRDTRPWTVEKLSDYFDVGIGKVKDALSQLSDKHVNLRESPEGGGIFISPEIPLSTPTVIPLASLKGQPHRFGLTSDNHLCFPAATTISTENGPERICNIKVGDQVLTHRGRYRAVKRIIKSRCDGRFRRIWFRGQHDGGENLWASLMATPNHPVRVARESGDEWVPLTEVQVGDVIRVRGKKCAHCDAIVPPWLHVCRSHDFYCQPANADGFVGCPVTAVTDEVRARS